MLKIIEGEFFLMSLVLSHAGQFISKDSLFEILEKIKIIKKNKLEPRFDLELNIFRLDEYNRDIIVRLDTSAIIKSENNVFEFKNDYFHFNLIFDNIKAKGGKFILSAE